MWECHCYPLLTGKLQSTQRTVTFSRTSPPSLLPQGMWKSVCSLRAVRRASMVSGGICTINPSVDETPTLLREQTFANLRPHCSLTLPSTMLDLAMKPEEAFRAPLNTTKLAPVTVATHRGGFQHQRVAHFQFHHTRMTGSHLCGSSRACCWPGSDSFPPRSGSTPGENRPPC